MVTQDPITIGTTPLTFTQFSSTGNLTAGVGINIVNGTINFDGASVAGDNLSWSSNKLNVTGVTLTSDFNSYTASTESRLTNIEGDITSISGDVITISGDLETHIDVFTGYTASTDVRLTNIENDITGLSATTEGKLDTAIFTGYTASTQSNEIFLIHTGGTNINTVSPTAIVWDSGVTVGSAYTWTGSTIEIHETATYEITYNVPFNETSGASDRAIGGNIVLNNTNVIDVTAAAGFTTGTGQAGSVGLPSININLTSGDKLDLVCFRTGRSGTTKSSSNGSILIKKKDTLQ